MSHDELLSFDVAALGEAIRARRISPVELTEAYLGRIELLDKRVNAYITVTAERARADAARAEAEVAAGNWRGPFHGVPVALKDLCYTRGIRTSAGAKILADFVPEYDSTVWARLAAAGAVLLGKLNMHEFANGASSTNPHFGAVRNPYNLDHIPGGSSGGCGTAIVARTAAATIGTDTGGSIRIPAAFCGCVGLKQTWGRVSRYGVIPLSDTLDHAGPIARTVRDAALMLNVIAGHDPNDATSSREPVPDYTSRLEAGVRGMRLGVITELTVGTSDEVLDSFRAALKVLESLGAALEEVSIPAIESGIALATAIMSPEAFDFHRRWFPERADDYGADVRRTMETAGVMPATGYIRAQRMRAGLLARVLEAMEGRAALLAPTAGIEPPLVSNLGRVLATPGGGTVNLVSAVLRFTAPFNVTGQPTLAIPTGLSRAGLPLSMQVVGRPFDELTVLQVGAAYERARVPLPPPAL
ncbi:MAG TPA: amidase [Candidatus Binataceae bacterium]|nr:amidase [Candidatus Binataceae bacterium]